MRDQAGRSLSEGTRGGELVLLMPIQDFFLGEFLVSGRAFVRPVVAHKLVTGSGLGGWNKQPSAKGKGIFY